MTDAVLRMRLLASRLCPAILAGSMLSWPGTSLAHAAFEGVGSFYGGLLHPAGVPAHILSLLAVGLFAGMRGWDYTVKALRLLILSSIGGLVLVWTGVELPSILPVLTSAAVVGVLVAVGPKVPPQAGFVLVTCIGFLVGFDSAPVEPRGTARLAALAGTAIGASAMFIWVSGPLSALARPWQHIAIRAAGSWVGASALLVLALAASGKSVGAS